MQQRMLNIGVNSSVIALLVIVTILVNERLGRKTLLLASTLSVALVYGVIGYLFHAQTSGGSSVLFSVLILAIYSLTLAPVVRAILSAIFP